MKCKVYIFESIANTDIKRNEFIILKGTDIILKCYTTRSLAEDMT